MMKVRDETASAVTICKTHVENVHGEKQLGFDCCLDDAGANSESTPHGIDGACGRVARLISDVPFSAA
jgi:hypothetical protein